MKIGVTGSLASGKSTVTKILAKKKYPIFNADLEVKNLYTNKTFIKKLGKKLRISSKKSFKKTILDMVANKKINLKDLEKIIHPIVRKKMRSFAIKNQKKKHILFEIPLLVESRLERFFDLIILVGASKKTRLKRYIHKKGNKKMFLFLNKRQIKNSKKIKYANYVIVNNKSLNHLKSQLSRIEDL
jgi:dephospho-CoA kinase|tara:strand:+ start:60 stop:617 length:558 start_codon:yes stop_codon:yes gene_type:complete